MRHHIVHLIQLNSWRFVESIALQLYPKRSLLQCLTFIRFITFLSSCIVSCIYLFIYNFSHAIILRNAIWRIISMLLLSIYSCHFKWFLISQDASSSPAKPSTCVRLVVTLHYNLLKLNNKILPYWHNTYHLLQISCHSFLTFVWMTTFYQYSTLV